MAEVKQQVAFKKVMEEHGKIHRSIHALLNMIYKSEVMKLELENVQVQTKEGERLDSPYYPCNEALQKLQEHLEPIFEKHAGRAAIRESKAGKL